MNATRKSQIIRYAVVGLGDIAQGAVLPAFKNARVNSTLTALISDDESKRRALTKEYDIKYSASYDDFESILDTDIFDAVYLTLPNGLHREFALQAARAGKHVLCEKPLAVTEAECRDMIETCAQHNVKLMTAYRLHFERANLEAIRLVRSGRIGELRIFQSLFSMQARAGNVRLQRQLGGGTLYDLGVYCINAARYLFRAALMQ